MAEVRFIANKEFTKSLKTALKFAPPRSAFKPLQNILLTFDEKRVNIRATNNRSSYERTIPILDLGVSAPFSVLIHRDLAKIIKSQMPLTFSPNHCILDSQTYTSLDSPNEFPAPLNAEMLDGIPVTVQYFSDLATCAKSASDSETRPVLLGVSHHADALSATDGLRLCEIKQLSPWGKGFIVPASFATILLDNFPLGAQVRVTETHAHYVGRGTQITIRLIDGSYPPIPHVLNEDLYSSAWSLPIDSARWINALQKIRGFYKGLPKRDRLYNNPVFLAGDNENCLFTTQVVNNGKAEATVPLSDSKGPFRATANAEYLLTAISQVGDAMLYISDDQKPLFFRSQNGRTRALVAQIHIR